MYGINNRPMIDLDEYVDVARFASLKDEIDIGLAKSDWEPGSFGPEIYEKKRGWDLFNLEEVSIPQGKHPDSAQVAPVLSAMPTLTQKRRYLKLRYGLYNSSHSVYL